MTVLPAAPHCNQHLAYTSSCVRCVWIKVDKEKQAKPIQATRADYIRLADEVREIEEKT